MKAQTLTAGFVLLYTIAGLCADFSALASEDFPSHPNEGLTPGTLCEEADEIRYPERIKYCTRDVKPPTKEMVVARYDSKLGYRVGVIGRHKFKIDHYIPLCMGGSNDLENLWPQHLSISAVTDLIETEACDKLAIGKLKQLDAIEIVKEAKGDLDRVPELHQYLLAL